MCLLRCVGTNRGGIAEASVRVEVVEEGIDMTAVIAGSSAAAFVMLVIIAIILHYIRGLKKKVRSNPKKIIKGQHFPTFRCAS